jgi:hypothetical protein
MRQREIAEKRMEDQHDAWFNQACPMVKPKKTWREKCLAKEQGHEDSSDNGQDQGDNRQLGEEAILEAEDR